MCKLGNAKSLPRCCGIIVILKYIFTFDFFVIVVLRTHINFLPLMVGGAVTAAEALVISLTVGETSAGVGSTDELKTDDPSGACSLTEDLIKGLKWDDTTTELT